MIVKTGAWGVSANPTSTDHALGFVSEQDGAVWRGLHCQNCKRATPLLIYHVRLAGAPVPPACRPPSITSWVPVMSPDKSELKYITALAISSGVA